MVHSTATTPCVGRSASEPLSGSQRAFAVLPRARRRHAVGSLRTERPERPNANPATSAVSPARRRHPGARFHVKQRCRLPVADRTCGRSSEVAAADRDSGARGSAPGRPERPDIHGARGGVRCWRSSASGPAGNVDACPARQRVGGRQVVRHGGWGSCDAIGARTRRHPPRWPSISPVCRFADNDRPAKKLSTPVVHRHPPFHVKQRVGAGVSLWMTACVRDLGSLWISPLGARATTLARPTASADPVARDRSNRWGQRCQTRLGSASCTTPLPQSRTSPSGRHFPSRVTST